MEDQSLFSGSQPKGISEGLQNFINAMVEEIVLEGKPFDSQKKYLRKFSENEGLDYEALEKSIAELTETLEEMKSSDSKTLLRLALFQAKEACVSEAEVMRIVEQMGEKETSFVKQNASEEDTQSAHGSTSTNEMGGSDLVFNVNGVDFKMVKVEGGTFWMGAHNKHIRNGLFSKTPDHSIPNYDEEAFIDEQPVHSVTLDSFYMGETQVTQALWKALMGRNPSCFKGKNRPVEQVSWDDCQAFIIELNILTGENFRLPTEAEWEYAARGGNKGNGYMYSGSNNIDAVAVYRENSGNKGKDSPDYGTHEVKSKQPNELGLYDMSGNVWEWCIDWHRLRYYVNSPSYNPRGPVDGLLRVQRGGSWNKKALTCRVSHRGYNDPAEGSPDSGFRLVLSK